MPRLTSGFEMSRDAAPYLVSLVDTQTGAHFCGGTILNSFVILTAAHCLFRAGRGKNESLFSKYGRKPSEIRVMAGKHDLQSMDEIWEQSRYVSMDYTHPYFEYSTLENDLGILKLLKPFKFNSRVKPVTLPTIRREFEGMNDFIAKILGI
jgi:chymotrypsin